MSEIYVDPTIDVSVIRVGGECYEFVGPSSEPPTSVPEDRFANCDDCQSTDFECLSCSEGGDTDTPATVVFCYSSRTYVQIDLSLSIIPSGNCYIGQQCGLEFQEWVAGLGSFFLYPGIGGRWGGSVGTFTCTIEGFEHTYDVTATTDCPSGACETYQGVSITFVGPYGLAIFIIGTGSDADSPISGPILQQLCCPGDPHNTPVLTGTGTMTLFQKDCCKNAEGECMPIIDGECMDAP